jgi:hypothetical protein
MSVVQATIADEVHRLRQAELVRRFVGNVVRAMAAYGSGRLGA